MKTSPNRIVMIICVFFIVFVLFNWKTLFKTAESFGRDKNRLRVQNNKNNHKAAIRQYRTRLPYSKDIDRNQDRSTIAASTAHAMDFLLNNQLTVFQFQRTNKYIPVGLTHGESYLLRGPGGHIYAKVDLNKYKLHIGAQSGHGLRNYITIDGEDQNIQYDIVLKSNIKGMVK